MHELFHTLRKNHIDWHSNKQSIVETATRGSEYSSDRTCIEQIFDLRVTVRCLGVPLRERILMFGDNDSADDSSMTPHRKHTKGM